MRRGRTKDGGGSGCGPSACTAPVRLTQAGDLVLLVLGLADTTAAVGGPRPQPPAIHRDGDHLRRHGHARRQLPPPALLGLLVACPRQLRADFLRQLLDRTGRDRQAAQTPGEGGIGEGVQAAARGNDLVQQAGAVAVAVKARQGPLGGQSPGGSRGSG
jgi:hypothetical protein